MISAIQNFPKVILEMADKISILNHGPFPLCHGDFSHHNVIVDDEYNILGLIDWEAALAGPWEVFGNFPLLLLTIPQSMDTRQKYDEVGKPNNTRLTQKIKDQQAYIAAVEREEDNVPECNHMLSKVLRNSQRRDLATALRLYTVGKVGWYNKLLDDLSK